MHCVTIKIIIHVNVIIILKLLYYVLCFPINSLLTLWRPQDTSLPNGVFRGQSPLLRKSFYKSLLNLAYLWSRGRLAINKWQKYFSLTAHQLPEFHFWLPRKDKKKGQKQFCNYIWKSYLRFFLFKNASQIPCKIFATQCFFTGYLKHKTVNKTTCRTPSANPPQLYAH